MFNENLVLLKILRTIQLMCYIFASLLVTNFFVKT